MGATSIRGRHLLIFLLSTAAFIRGRRLFEGGVKSNKYIILNMLPMNAVVPLTIESDNKHLAFWGTIFCSTTNFVLPQS